MAFAVGAGPLFRFEAADDGYVAALLEKVEAGGFALAPCGAGDEGRAVDGRAVFGFEGTGDAEQEGSLRANPLAVKHIVISGIAVSYAGLVENS